MPTDPYAHAPRLPEGDAIDPCSLFLTNGATTAHGSASFTTPAGASATTPGDAVYPEGATRAPASTLVELEIGPGRGWFTVERVEADPNAHIIGFEVRRKWATIVDERLQKRGHGHRARVFAEDVKLALPRLRADSISVAYVHFPDPWWKKRHHKRLVVSGELLDELARVVVAGGELFIQTDVPERADQYEAIVAAHPAFEPVEETPRVEDHPYVARSPRERKAIENGLPVYRLRYRRRAAGGEQAG